ncbi:MAG: hypothetical protein GF368_02475 [Candidatus Aenigmarchaeota archaeon]|nr:hypothetical protein [Candidatus Aenigmarchaeota archaeon]
MKSPAEFAVKVAGVTYRELKKHTPAIIQIPLTETQKETLGKKDNYKNGWIDFDWDILRDKFFRKKLDPVVEDLLIIALSVFYVDSVVERDSKYLKRSKDSRFFSREIKLYVPVSDKKLWDRVRIELEKTISFMTYDLFEFEFLQRKGQVKKRNILKQRSEHSFIALFSGGLDSLAGSQFLLENEKGKPLFVSVKHGTFGGVIEHLIDKLKIDAIDVRYGDKPKDKDQIKKEYRKFHKPSEWTQFSRSFLYLTVGVAVALPYSNIKDIHIPENGVIAHNIGLGEARRGTRTANPRFLRYFEDLINSVFPEAKIQIKDNFIYETKGDVVDHLIQKKEVIKESISCARYARYTDENSYQCGMCIPCIYRIIALTSKNLYPTFDRKISSHGMNIFLANLLKPDLNSELTKGNVKKIIKFTKDDYPVGVINVLDVINFAATLKTLEKKDVVRKYPSLIDEQLYLMYQRFAEEVESTVNFFGDENPSLKSVWREYTKH